MREEVYYVKKIEIQINLILEYSSDMGCCQSHLLNQLQTTNKTYLEDNLAGEPTEYSKEFIHALLSGIQDHHRKKKNQRIRKHPTPLLKGDFKEYVKDVLVDLKEQEREMKEMIGRLTIQLGAPIFNKDAVEKGIKSYMEDRGIGRREVQAWLKEKTGVVRQDGKELAKKVSSSSQKKQEKERCFEIYQVIVDDRLQTQKDFLLSVAYEFLWTDELKIESQQWLSSIKSIYPSFAPLLG